MKKAIRIFDLILFIVSVVLFAVIIWGNSMLPNNIITYDDNEIPFSKVFSYNSRSNALLVDSQSASQMRRDIKLFGIVPVKEVMVANEQSTEVYASGEIFGIKLYTDGVIIVGTQPVDTDDGKKNPAQACGIQVGDIIVAIDGVNVYTSDQVQQILSNNNGNSFSLKIKRGERYRELELKPVYCQREGCYKAGMWVRDSTAGIGTITFYNKDTGIFGALGHPVNDVDTKELMPLLEGEAVKASVTSIDKSSKGTTGSIQCDFLDYTIGRLINNTQCGIYGSYAEIPQTAISYPVASAQEVVKGNATIISTLADGEPREYDIEIMHISFNESNQEKNMIVKVTDSRLLQLTGGIVQGMSGSPIIQNGKLVGALTHVIVGNPQKGYAVFAQTMLKESEK